MRGGKLLIYTKTLKTVVLKVKEGSIDYGACSDKDKACEIARSIYDGLDDDQEHFTALFLNGLNVVRGYKVLVSGKMNSAEVEYKDFVSSCPAIWRYADHLHSQPSIKQQVSKPGRYKYYRENIQCRKDFGYRRSRSHCTL